MHPAGDLIRTLARIGRANPDRSASSVVDLRMYAVAIAPGAIQRHVLLRKEVIQPHLPIRLPCYDFVPLTWHTLDALLLAVARAASGTPNSGDVTGGVYKARERIQRSVADLRLLAIPTS
jgi:hypothetical protein